METDRLTSRCLTKSALNSSKICAHAQQARAAGASRVYWQTHETNSAGRLLYDKVARHHGFIVYALDL